MKRIETLNDAIKCVSKDRNNTHGNPEDCFESIAKFWSIYLGFAITSNQVAMCMALLKIARQSENPQNTDNYVDLAGYAACASELSEK